MSIKVIRSNRDPIEFVNKLKKQVDFTVIAARKISHSTSLTNTLLDEYTQRMKQRGKNLSVLEVAKEISQEFKDNQSIEFGLRDVKVVSCEWQSVMDALESAKIHVSSLNYTLPFKSTLLFFEKPICVRIYDNDEKIVCLLLQQNEVKPEDIIKVIKADPISMEFMTPSTIEKANKGESFVSNGISAIYDDWASTSFGWKAGSKTEFSYDESGDYDEDVRDLHTKIKKIAVAVVGYINCSNVVLEPRCHSNHTSEKGHKWARENKKNEYYVCRITKQFEPTEQESPTVVENHIGSEHSYRYDVRGHFRNLKSGETIWVKPHLRGLKNETYLPKQYAVNVEN